MARMFFGGFKHAMARIPKSGFIPTLARNMAMVFTASMAHISSLGVQIGSHFRGGCQGPIGYWFAKLRWVSSQTWLPHTRDSQSVLGISLLLMARIQQLGFNLALARIITLGFKLPWAGRFLFLFLLCLLAVVAPGILCVPVFLWHKAVVWVIPLVVAMLSTGRAGIV